MISSHGCAIDVVSNDLGRCQGVGQQLLVFPLSLQAQLFEDTIDNAVAAHGVKLEGLGGGRAGSRIEVLPQSSTRAMQPDFHVFGTEVEAFGCFICAHSFNITQHENHTVVFGQFQNCLLQHPAKFTIVSRFFGVAASGRE